MTTQWKSLLDKLEAYTESSAPVDWAQEIKSIATICAEQHKPLKAAISQLRGLLAKHQRDIEKQSGKMLSNALGNLAEGPELSAKNPAITYLLTNVHAGADIGVGTEVAKWNDESAPVVVSAGEFVAEVTKHDAYKPYMKWFDEKAEEKKQDKLVAAADIALSKAVLTTACANIGDAMVLREKKLFVKREQRVWAQSLFEIQLYMFAASANSTSALPLGLAEARVATTGRILIAGVKLNFGMSYGEQLQGLKNASGSALSGMLKGCPSNFAFVLEPGSLCLIPSGYLGLHYALEPCKGFRWGLFPRHEGEHRRVMQTLSAVIDAFPAMNSGPYQQWLAHLMSDPRSHALDASAAPEASEAAQLAEAAAPEAVVVARSGEAGAAGAKTSSADGQKAGSAKGSRASAIADA